MINKSLHANLQPTIFDNKILNNLSELHKNTLDTTSSIISINSASLYRSNSMSSINSLVVDMAASVLSSSGSYNNSVSSDLVSTANSLTIQNATLFSAASTISKTVTENAPAVTDTPTAGLFTILPPQLLRRSKGEVKITNTNLQSSNKTPIEVLTSTITPTYNKKKSTIYPELFEVVDKIFDKVVSCPHLSCPELNEENEKLVKLIEIVKNETASLAKTYGPNGP